MVDFYRAQTGEYKPLLSEVRRYYKKLLTQPEPGDMLMYRLFEEEYMKQSLLEADMPEQTPQPWERLLKRKDKPAYITRVGTSGWGVEPYEYGFVVGKIDYNHKKETYRITGNRTMYPSDIPQLITIIMKLGTKIDGTIAAGLTEALEGTIAAHRAAAELAQRLVEISHE